jgi:hypothetical protein
MLLLSMAVYHCENITHLRPLLLGLLVKVDGAAIWIFWVLMSVMQFSVGILVFGW